MKNYTNTELENAETITLVTKRHQDEEIEETFYDFESFRQFVGFEFFPLNEKNEYNCSDDIEDQIADLEEFIKENGDCTGLNILLNALKNKTECWALACNEDEYIYYEKVEDIDYIEAIEFCLHDKQYWNIEINKDIDENE